MSILFTMNNNTNVEMSPIFKNIPLDILRENIMPYAMSPQSNELMRDVRSFREDLGIIENIYHTQYNDTVLYDDLMFYVNNVSVSPNKTAPRYQEILRRYMPLKNATNNEIILYFNKIYMRPLSIQDIIQRNRMLLGLLTPDERTNFINTYILG